MTPFEAAGYTKDTVLRVCATDRAFALGTLVQLKEDDGSECPLFDSSTDTAYIFLSGLEYVSGPRKILMNREELTDLINEILDAREGLPSIPPGFTRWRGVERPVPFDTKVEARKLRTWFDEHAPTKFKYGDMVVCDGRVCIVCGIAPYSNMRKYIVFAQDFCRYMEEAELTPYEEGK